MALQAVVLLSTPITKVSAISRSLLAKVQSPGLDCHPNRRGTSPSLPRSWLPLGLRKWKLLAEIPILNFVRPAMYA